MNYAVLGIAMALLAIGAGNAYSDNGMVNFPQIPDNHLTGQIVSVNYHDDYKWTVTVTTQFQVNKIIELPETIHYMGIDGQIHTINIKEDFIIANTPISSDPVEVEETLTDAAKDSIDAKKAEDKAKVEEAWGKLNECLEQFEEESPIRFEAWKRTANLESFEIPDETIAWKSANYATEELKAEQAWQICEAIKNYKWIGIQESNKSMAEAEEFFELDETDSPLTDPVTADDILVEQEIAEAFACSEAGKQQGLCITHFGGEEYVPKFSRLPAWYGQYLEQRDTSNDLENAIARSLATQCTEYYPLYEHKVGMESFPEWLSHCVGTTND